MSMGAQAEGFACGDQGARSRGPPSALAEIINSSLEYLIRSCFGQIDSRTGLKWLGLNEGFVELLATDIKMKLTVMLSHWPQEATIFVKHYAMILRMLLVERMKSRMKSILNVNKRRMHRINALNICIKYKYIKRFHY